MIFLLKKNTRLIFKVCKLRGTELLMNCIWLIEIIVQIKRRKQNQIAYFLLIHLVNNLFFINCMFEKGTYTLIWISLNGIFQWSIIEFVSNIFNSFLQTLFYTISLIFIWEIMQDIYLIWLNTILLQGINIINHIIPFNHFSQYFWE